MFLPVNPAASRACLQWRGACGGFNLAGRTTGAVLGASCWVAGLAVLVEKRSRRMELALYLLARVGGWDRCSREWREVPAQPCGTDKALRCSKGGQQFHRLRLGMVLNRPSCLPRRRPSRLR